ncbi:hypothetical protein P7H21_00020 [Paenibacillus larvae]|nr:hypothetical protein [Paenibacillus larvae]MDT2302745.1 hypothetical protein [Paenibacillus larvae]
MGKTVAASSAMTFPISANAGAAVSTNVLNKPVASSSMAVRRKQGADG